jgi:hypothetical protein
VIDVTVSGWLEELRQSGASLREYTHTVKDDKHMLVGPAYRQGWGRRSPENHALEWFSYMRSRCLMGNPRVRWVSDSPDQDTQTRSSALTHACNAWTQRTNMRNLNEELLMDYGFKWSVCLVTSEPAPGWTGTNNAPYWPAAYRLPTEWFRFDMAARRAEARRWSAHLNIGSRTQLLELADDPKSGWDKEVLEGIVRQNVRKFRDDRTVIPERDEIPYWEIWAPDVELPESKGRDKGYNGTIYTLVDEQSATLGFPRKPRPYFGPPTGPYVFGGDYVVPDESLPMGPLTATKYQAEYVNKIARATIRAVEKYKNIVLVRNGSNLPDIIKDGTDQYVFSIDDPDVRSSVTQVQVAGATEQHFAAKMDAQATLDRNSGITDLMRGQVDHRNKATADALAAQASESRTSYTEAKFHAFIARIIWTVGYFIDRDEDIEIEIPESAGMMDPKTGRPATKVKGGLAKGQSAEEFFGHQLSLEIGSMERDLAQDVQLRQGILDMTIQQIAALGPQTALYIDWQKYLDTKAELTGVHELKDIVNVPMMQMLAMQMLQQQAQQGQQGQPGGAPQRSPQPDYSRTVNMKNASPPQTSLPQSMANRGSHAGNGAGPAKQLTAKPVGSK